eukprot:Protomagalhaensia_wolfi_Nauph_80__3176@NODE_3230_length_850_cov_56_565968_g117_i1_p1_GENE_NODE_3230_length_850_cov_56_565968_g117_i1NODE_3230_length_850_cov_56_565968_g117_i1_p1_ORF_typecomplete_len231_score41_35C2/PF00168_30/8_3e12_NODE_3230_length_850_cov_56_565968_g117_i180772
MTETTPIGGFDNTPIPPAPPGYTLRFTFHSAANLPIGDLATFSSDPYVLAQLNTALPPRNKEDPPLRMRSPTLHRAKSPEWNWSWVVANVPASGFKLKIRVYDEDVANHDDCLGNVHIEVPQLVDTWKGPTKQAFTLKRRLASKRALALRAAAVAVRLAASKAASITLSIELLGRTQDPYNMGGRTYTIGPLFWVKHSSPLLGVLVNVYDDGGDQDIKYDKEGNKIRKFK